MNLVRRKASINNYFSAAEMYAKFGFVNFMSCYLIIIVYVSKDFFCEKKSNQPPPPIKRKHDDSQSQRKQSCETHTSRTSKKFIFWGTVQKININLINIIRQCILYLGKPRSDIIRNPLSYQVFWIVDMEK